MKIVVLANNYSMTTATALAHLLKKNEVDVVSVITVRGLFKKKSMFGSILYSVNHLGLRYTVNKFLLWLQIKLRAASPKYFRLGNEKIYYSLDELKKKVDFEEKQLDDINSEKAERYLKNLNPDIIFSLSFPYILKENILRIPKLGTINLHRSYLPKFRGGSPVFWVRAMGEKSTGFTIHHISEGAVDSGNILIQKRIEIDYKRDSHKKIMLKLCNLIPEALDQLFSKINGELPVGIEQNEEEASSFRKPDKSVRVKYGIWD
ncbi:methionyl-tRNA formyltransferase [Rhodohalobacter sp. 8-1]|uniref:methionyl-tRNA formyltransferase n=1 Tax=Rhodohalobacter sp. 8-1 TaxID=3131972 RepID=UPI0030EDCACE